MNVSVVLGWWRWCVYVQYGYSSGSNDGGVFVMVGVVGVVIVFVVVVAK